VRERPDALFVGNDAFLTSRSVQLVHLATLHKVPAAYSLRETAEVGGPMSYGANVNDALRQVGVYAGRILKGATPADLPVIQSSKFELVINAVTARMLGLTVPPSLLSVAVDGLCRSCPCSAFRGGVRLGRLGRGRRGPEVFLRQLWGVLRT
jgi:putative tryptophan/tyrosine transport system substrate-binding protein